MLTIAFGIVLVALFLLPKGSSEYRCTACGCPDCDGCDECLEDDHY